MTIKFLRSQEIGYGLLLAEQQRIASEIRDFAIQVLKDNGGDASKPWQFNPVTLDFTLKEEAPSDAPSTIQ